MANKLTTCGQLEALAKRSSAESAEVAAASLAAVKEVANQLHTHGNKTVLDGITINNVTNWNGAYDHSRKTDNPHQVSKAQVGLGNVDNTSDLNKPVSKAQQAALEFAQTAGLEALRYVKLLYAKVAKFNSFPMIILGNSSITIIKVSSTEVRIEFSPGMLAYGANGNASSIAVDNLLEGKGLVAAKDEDDSLAINASIDKKTIDTVRPLIYMGVAPSFHPTTGELLSHQTRVYFDSTPYPAGLTGVLPIGHFITSGESFERGFMAYDSRVKTVGW